MHVVRVDEGAQEDLKSSSMTMVRTAPKVALQACSRQNKSQTKKSVLHMVGPTCCAAMFLELLVIVSLQLNCVQHAARCMHSSR